MNTNPFSNAAPKAPVANPVTASAVNQTTVQTAQPQAQPVNDPGGNVFSTDMTNANQTAPTTQPVSEGGKKPRKPRKQPNHQMTVEQRKYVLANYTSKSINDIASELNLTRQQVYRTVSESRKILQKRQKSLMEMPDDTPNKAEQLEKIQKALDRLPMKAAGSGSRGGKNTVDAALDDLLNGLI